MNTSSPRGKLTRSTFMKAVESALEAELTNSGGQASGRLVENARFLTLSGEAKRARPALCFSFAEVAGRHQGWSALVDGAAGIELMHTASLLHDDVVDGDVVRRGRATVNAREGNSVAVLTGDFVLARAFSRFRRWPAVLSRAVDVLEQMTVAALREREQRGDALVTLDAWRAMAEGKTGVLFGLCGAVADLTVGDGARAAAWFEAGTHLGVAFQIADDVADLPAGDDVRERNPSFPVVVAAARSARVRQALRRTWLSARPSSAQVADVVREVHRAGGLIEAVDAARTEVEHARHLLGPDGRHPSMVAVLTWADALVDHAAQEAA